MVGPEKNHPNSGLKARRRRRVVSAFVATAFAQDDAEAARNHWRRTLEESLGVLSPV
jgi:hypothetical protein